MIFFININLDSVLIYNATDSHPLKDAILHLTSRQAIKSTIQVKLLFYFTKVFLLY